MDRAAGEKPLEEKLPHKEVEYQRESPVDNQRCGNCSMFISAQPYRCTDVVTPIYKGGWCNIWAPGEENDEQ